jgi:glycosyltransferase involved in cell wall biosynthesis
VRVLLVTGSLPPLLCGVGDYTDLLTRSLEAVPGLEVCVLTSTGAHSEKTGARCIKAVMPDWAFFRIPTVLSFIRKWKPDIVHFQYPTLGYGACWMPYFLPAIVRTLGIKVVQTWHEPPSRFRYIPNAIVRDSLITVEPNYIAGVRKRYSWLIRRKKLRFIPLCSNIPRVNISSAERSAIRRQFVADQMRMIVFFGFLYPTKRAEVLFEVADPKRDALVFISSLQEGDPYHARIQESLNKWPGRATVTGPLPPIDVAKTLSAADVAIFPFAEGVHRRNGSFLAAQCQGTFTITTSRERKGLDSTQNVFYVHPEDINAMRDALNSDLSLTKAPGYTAGPDWTKIAELHSEIYRNMVRT